MAFFVVHSNPELSAGAKRVADRHIPFIIREDGFYPKEANRYLRARCLCEWKPKLGSSASSSKSRRRFLTARSAWECARNLAKFLSWCQSGELDWRKVTYVEDLLAWQDSLISGEASHKKKALGPSRVNNLLLEACYFCTWTSEFVPSGSDEPLPPFEIPITEGNHRRSNNAVTPSRKSEDSRTGALPVRGSTLSIPSWTDLNPWLTAMTQRHPVKALMAKLILATGMRLNECLQWTVDTLPPRSTWRPRSGKLEVRITLGIKGPKTQPLSQVSLNPRDILVPIELAEEIEYYRAIQRPVQLRRWIHSAADSFERSKRRRCKKPDRLWLSEFTNQPFSAHQFYEAWVKTPHCPDGWHPHRGRHFFAVEKVTELIRSNMAIYAHPKVPELGWLYGVLNDQVRLTIAPLLGHCNEDTTMIYLKAAHIRILEEFEHPAMRWLNWCDASEPQSP